MSIILFGVSFLFLLAGSYLLSLNLYIWDAGLLLFLGAVGTLYTLYRLGYLRFSWPRISVPAVTPTQRYYRWARWLAVGLSGLVGVAARSLARDVDYSLFLLLWLVALTHFAASLFFHHEVRSFRFSLPRREALLLGLLTVVALLLRAIALGHIPSNMGGDEGTQALLAFQLVTPPLGNPFTVSWYSVPTFSFLAYGVGMRLFGATIAGARALSALAGALTIPAVFLLGRWLGGRRVGWVAACCMTFFAYHIHFSRLASNQIFDPLVGAVTVALLWRACRDTTGRTTWAWGLAGMAAGMGWYAYFGARWATFLIVLLLAERFLREPRFFARQWRGMGLFVAGWLVTTLPLLAWYVAHPADMTARYNAVSIFVSGWLAREIQVTGKSALVLMGQQFWKSATAFHLTPDPTFWYYPQTPLLDFISGTLLFVGLLISVVQWRRPSRLWVLLWFTSALTMAWALTENPPSSQRGLLLLPPVALLIAWGIEGLWALLRRHRREALAVTVMLLLLIGALNSFFYFGLYTPRRVYGNPTAQIATETARYVLLHPLPEAYYYFHGAPYLYWDFGTLAFLLRDLEGQDVPQGVIPEVVAPARFVFVPERAEEFFSVQAYYPGGQMVELRNPQGELLAILYDWDGGR